MWRILPYFWATDYWWNMVGEFIQLFIYLLMYLFIDAFRLCGSFRISRGFVKIEIWKIQYCTLNLNYVSAIILDHISVLSLHYEHTIQRSAFDVPQQRY